MGASRPPLLRPPRRGHRPRVAPHLLLVAAGVVAAAAATAIAASVLAFSGVVGGEISPSGRRFSRSVAPQAPAGVVDHALRRPPARRRASASLEAVARAAGGKPPLDLSDPGALEELLQDPERARQVQAELDKFMADPAKRQALEQWSHQIQGAVERLRGDPEMKAFFDDVEANGVGAWRRYEKDDRILRKYAEALGGPTGLKGFDVPSSQPASFKPGDVVVISGLTAHPARNGRQAMVVPATVEERSAIEGTGRLVVRLLDTGEQFAVKPENLGSPITVPAGVLASAPFVSMVARFRDTGVLEEIEREPELQPMLEDIRRNGMSSLEKYWSDDGLMAKLSKALGGHLGEQ